MLLWIGWAWEPLDTQKYTGKGVFIPNVEITLRRNNPLHSHVIHRCVVTYLSGLGFDACSEIGNLVVQAASFTNELSDFTVGVHHGGVITATESLTNFW